MTCPCHVCAVERADDATPTICVCHPSMCRPIPNGMCLACRRPLLELIDTPAVQALVADATWRPELRGKQ